MKLHTPILITGASGFVGANLLYRLIKKKIPPKKIHLILRKSSNSWRIKEVLKKISVHVIDLRNETETFMLLKKIKPKTIFHLATHGAYPYQENNEREIVETNIIGTFNLIRASLNTGFSVFINTGTSSEYGVNQKPMSEKDVLSPVTAYGVSKAWATLYSNYLATSKNVPITTLRLFGVYGFCEPRGRLIPNIILSLLKKESPSLNKPNFKRDFVFIDDVINAYFIATEKRHIGGVFNIGSGKQTTLEEIFFLIQKVMKVDVEPIWGNFEDQLFDTNCRIASIKLVKKHLGWKPETTLESGLKQTVKWFKKNSLLYS